MATAIGLAAAALGTETDGSIVCPSSFNNLVGVKPTVGLTSRDGGTFLPMNVSLTCELTPFCCSHPDLRAPGHGRAHDALGRRCGYYPFCDSRS